MDSSSQPKIKDRHGLEIMSTEECWGLLRRTPIGRVAFVHDGEPVVLPVAFGVIGHQIAFRSARGAKLGAARMNQPVAFEVDNWDATSLSGWSVLIEGSADTVYTDSEIAELEALGVMRWTPQPFDTDWVRILPNDISGRRTSATT
jgi:nitroimidazol reductase NimA-like FMN-containing flavoprotein (pyridoxamine 5'-phosphate oxidase superfamily)